MAVKIQHHEKSARPEAKAKPASGKATSKPAENMGFFASLLNSLKPHASDGKQANNFANFQHRPASSKINNLHPQPGMSKHTKPGSSQPTQNVNNLAASALISLSAMSSSSKTNRGNNFYSRGGGIAGHPGIAPLSFQPPAAGNASTNVKQTQGIGKLSAIFESGEKGPEVIGFDDRGGTSYGTFQISSKAGTMKQFVDYLSERAPTWAEKLKAAGPANTGGRIGRMPEAWKKLAAEDPAGFSKMQYDFIEKTHYLPAVQEISERTGVNVAQYPKAVREVLWSTAVQHGPNGAAKIFSKAISKSQTQNGGIQMPQLIKSVYNMRAGQFESSSSDIRASVQSRFAQEGKLALAMLSDPFQQPEGVKV
jgi:hypothetical protein